MKPIVLKHCVCVVLKWAKKIDRCGNRTHASEETSALNWRLRPLGQTTLLSMDRLCASYIVVIHRAEIRTFSTCQGAINRRIDSWGFDWS